MPQLRAGLPRYGPYHRRCSDEPRFIDIVVRTHELRGRRRRNIYAGAFPCVKAWNGPLPADTVGFEFYTEISPDPDTPPDWPQWSEGRPGVKIVEGGELVAIDVVVTNIFTLS